MKYDSWRPPSRPNTTFPDTRLYGATGSLKTDPRALGRTQRGALWFAVNRRGSGTVLHHRHIRPVLIRDWSPQMDGIAATIWASRTTNHPVGNGTTRQ